MRIYPSWFQIALQNCVNFLLCISSLYLFVIFFVFITSQRNQYARMEENQFMQIFARNSVNKIIVCIGTKKQGKKSIIFNSIVKCKSYRSAKYRSVLVTRVTKGHSSCFACYVQWLCVHKRRIWLHAEQQEKKSSRKYSFTAPMQNFFLGEIYL